MHPELRYWRRWKDMSCSCLRYNQTPTVRNSLPLLNAYARFYGTKPRPASANSREDDSNNVSPNPDEHDAERAIRARHWLRAILRECTYLPDPNARRYVSQYAISRFRIYAFKEWKNRNKKPIPGFKERLIGKEKEARHAVGLLKRANEGELKPLLKVLFMTYGRSGKRRHELLEPLLIKPAEDEAAQSESGSDRQVETDQVSDNALEQDVEGASEKARPTPPEKKYALPQALYMLAHSQQQADPPDRTRPNPRRLRPDIPALNSKMRPMPESRVKNMTKKWYADLLDRILPPLPEDEWHHLREMAHGHGLSKQPAKRKAPPGMQSVAQREESALEMVIVRGSGNLDPRVFGNREAHTITTRYMQRLYAIVFRQCPRMELDSERNKWVITWGKYALNSNFEKHAVK